MVRTSRRVVSCLLVCVLVAAAGCAGLSPSGSAGQSLQSDGGDAAVSAPGVSADGLQNASELTAANREALLSSGYVAQVRLDATMTRGERSRNFSLAQREAVEPSATEFVYQTVRQVSSTRSRMAVWSNQSTAVLRNQRSNQTNYQRVQRSRIVKQLTGQQLFAQYVAAGNYTLANTTTTDNETVYVFRSDEYAQQTAKAMPSVENVSSYQSRFAVDSAGRIQYMDVTMRYSGPRGGTAEMQIRYVLQKTGDVSVRKPGWVDEALSSSGSNSDGHGGGSGGSGHHDVAEPRL